MSTPSPSTTIGPAVTLLYGAAPESLDPGLDDSTQGAEINWLVYTGLTTYAHAGGSAGTQLIPGLATALPQLSDGGRTYTVTLRKGLVFSDGRPVRASDFTYTVERALEIPWGGSGQFIAPWIQGARAYAAGKAASISGITADDATGKIVIRLTAPYGAFDNVLAFPALGIVPTGTPFTVNPASPPPGVGPYRVTNVVPKISFTAVSNPYWAQMAIPGIPAGHVSVDAKIDPNVGADAVAVLNNTADVLDWADPIPRRLLARIRSHASGRFSLVDLGGSTSYVFFDTANKPFDNQLAREAVVIGLNQRAIARAASSALVSACVFLPAAVPGHTPDATCPYGPPGAGYLVQAKALVRRSGLEGYPVTVFGETSMPRRQWMTSYTAVLNAIGFKATLKMIPDAAYSATIGDPGLHPQTGFADRNMDFPNPADFLRVLTPSPIAQTDNGSPGAIDDAHLNAQLAKLVATPASDRSSLARQGRAIDQYVAKRVYVAVLGYQTFPALTSDRIDYGAVVLSPEYGWDWTSFQLT